jgi:N-acyl-D-aspartate/D-glutamate deacylase
VVSGAGGTKRRLLISAPEWAEGYPGATERLIQCSKGILVTIVNGKVIYQDGKLSGEMAGKVLRGIAYQAGQ